MDNYYEEPTWEEIYYSDFPHLRKKAKNTSFSALDIIRFYENNLTLTEQGIVLAYFKEPKIKIPKIKTPVPEPLPSPTILLPSAPVLLSLPLPEPLSLPPPISFPSFLLPIFPFIIVPLLPPDILRYLNTMLGVTELEAAVIDLEKDIIDLEKEVDYWRGVLPKSPPRQTYPPTFIQQKVPYFGADDRIKEEPESISISQGYNPTEQLWDDFFGESDDPGYEWYEEEDFGIKTYAEVRIIIESIVDYFEGDLIYTGWWSYPPDGARYYQFYFEDKRLQYTTDSLKELLAALKSDK